MRLRIGNNGNAGVTENSSKKRNEWMVQMTFVKMTSKVLPIFAVELQFEHNITIYQMETGSGFNLLRTRE